MAKQQQRIDPAKTYVAVESFAGLLENGTEVNITKGTSLIGSNRIVSRWPMFFGEVGAPETWPRPFERVVETDMATDAQLKREQARHEGPAIAVENRVVAVISFFALGRAINEGQVLDRADEVVRAFPQNFQIPARPLVGGGA